MKATQFIPFNASSPNLTDDNEFVLAVELLAQNNSEKAGRVDARDVTKEKASMNSLFVSQWDQRSMQMLLPCKICDLELQADFTGRIAVTVRTEHMKLYRAYLDIPIVK